jgi:hypothetical protein
MAFNFSRFNTARSTVCGDIDTRKLDFYPLKDHCGYRLLCDGFFFTEGKYGRQVVAVCEAINKEGYNEGLRNINMPSRAVEQFEYIKKDPKALEAVLRGELVIHDIRMIETKNGSTAAFEFTSGEQRFVTEDEDPFM